MTLLPAETSLFDTIAGLPVHPLIVHAAVVLLPLAALMQVIIVFVPRWRARWATPTLLGLITGTVACFVAKESGEALAAHVGMPRTHALWGDILPFVAALLVAIAAVWWVLDRRDTGSARGGLPLLITGLLSVALALASLVLSVVVGHSGAQAAWGGRLESPATTAASAPATSTSSSSSTSTSASKYSMAAVQAHNTASSCWAVVSGNVYDLTGWIAGHPGGASVIKAMCGTDATASFTGQHGNQREPNSTLATFKLAKLNG